MKIAFYLPHADLQGTGVSVFDYCYYNREILNNESFFIFDKVNEYNHPKAIEKFENANIPILSIDGRWDQGNLEQKLNEIKADALYIQKLGKISEGNFASNVPTFIHSVGLYNEPHGTVYSYVSEWLSLECSKGEHPFVPYIVRLPEHNENLRKKLNIPEDAIVFGRIGGYYSWNIPWVNSVIEQILNQRKDVYFLFLQTGHFLEHERIFYCESFSDLNMKKAFINTCDAMIHAREEGESFGLACAEFSLCNKPVITYKNSPQKNHIFILKDKGIYYSNSQELYDIFLNFKSEPQKDWNAYKDFNPNTVIEKFKTIFIDKV